MSMDIHERYRTEAHTDIVCRFNERCSWNYQEHNYMIYEVIIKLILQ